MKTVRKTLILAACAIMLVCATIAGTLAYLTAQESVENTFTVGNVGIKLDETIVNPDGTPVVGEGAGRTEDGNKYKLLPGKIYTKDPQITVNAGSEESWLFVKLENGIKNIATTSTIESQMTANGNWTLIDEVNNIYAYKETVEAGDEIPVFNSFTIDSDVDATELGEYTNAKIVVTAYAIQADGFTTAQAAWDVAGAEAQAQG